MQTIFDLGTALLAQQWLWGAIVGGGIAFATQRLQFRHSVGEQRRVATMQIASQIRLWLIETMRVFREQPIFDQPDPNSDPNDPYGYYFPTPSDIPAFPFADALERISLLRSDDAENLFNLIERRLNAEKEASLTAWVDDHEAASDLFEAKIADIYIDCSAIYCKLAKKVGWTREVITDEELDEMRKRARPKAEASNDAPFVALDDFGEAEAVVRKIDQAEHG
ncbi:MAG: hypothetical protein ABSA49_03755 [Rhizomicrobium sp.]|jgi:hypothetical protein